MSIMEQLTNDMKDAMRSGDKVRVSVIRMARNAIRQIEIDNKKTLNDDEILTVLSKEVKMRRDSIEEFSKGGRIDLVDKTRDEIDVLITYMPEQLSEEKVTIFAKEAIETVGAVSNKDIGKVMGILMPKLQGKADGKVVNRIVQTLLNS